MFYLDTKKSRNFAPKDFKCVGCEGMKRRRDLVVFVRNEYNNKYECIQKVLSKFSDGELSTKVHYICKKCRSRFNGRAKCNDKNVEHDINMDDEEFQCTCCHVHFERKKQVVIFKRNNYDFENEEVKFALNSTMRVKNSIYEYICKGCHYDLRKRNGVLPKIPNNAYCRQKSVSSNGERRTDWNSIMSRMCEMQSFEELKRYIYQLDLPVVNRNFKGTSQLRDDQRDYLSNTLIPSDIGVPCNELFPVHTSGAGSCLYYALSRIVYGNERHCVEMRVRVVVEGVRNMHLYIDHDYLCRGYDFPHGEGIFLPQMYAVYLNLAQCERSMTANEVVEHYKRDMFHMRRFGQESGIWQLHQAANVLGCCIQSVYPEVNENFTTLRTDYNRLILPADLNSAGSCIMVMWTKGCWNSLRFGHFVPLVKCNPSLCIVDTNFCPIGYVSQKKSDTIIDLTSSVEIGKNDDLKQKHLTQGISSRVEQCVDEMDMLEINSLKKGDDIKWEDVSGKIDDLKVKRKVFLCTSCHRQLSNPKDVKLFKMNDYNFNNCVVADILSDVRRCKENTGLEYICKPCNESLTLKTPNVPRNCSLRKTEEDTEKVKVVETGSRNTEHLCTCCHRKKSKKIVLLQFIKNEFDFKNPIVKKVLSRKHRKLSYDGRQYICVTCHSKLCRQGEVEVPVKSVYNLKNITALKSAKIEKGSIEDAGEKFMRSCKELPEYVCTCCHRMLFRKTVDVFRRDKYKFGGICDRILSDQYRYKDKDKDEEYICQTCNKDLKQDRMPCQAVANGLEITHVPLELQGLSRLEVRCIALRIPFMMISALPKGKRGKIRGACVNVPATLQPIAEVLPRVPEDMDLVILKFKRIIVSKSNYLTDYIRPQRVMGALRWLKDNNPHYNHVTIDDNWLQKFESHDLFQCMVEEDEKKEGTEFEEGRSSSEEMEIDEECSKKEEDMKMDTFVDKNTLKEGNNSDGDTDDEEDERQFQEDMKESERKSEITIGSTATCVQFENPDEVAFSIAPGQNSIPKFILMDEDFEVLAFPNLFPYGKGGFTVLQPRERDLNLRRYVNQRLLNKDGRFGQNIEFIFAFQYATELKQLRTDMSMSLKRRSSEGKRITVGDMRNFQKVNNMIWKDIAYKFMKNVRGTPAYWQVQLYDTLAMLRTYGTPTWFVSLSPAEFMWPEFMQAVGKRNGHNWSEDDVKSMDWMTKAEHFRLNAVTVDQMFESRIESFFKDFIQSKAEPLGPVAEYVQKIEFQVRGTPHAHVLIWIKDAPRVGKNTDEEVCNFVDKYINGRIPCDIPENEDIRELVQKLQTHRHNACCRKLGKSKCRFNFPRPPSTRTIIARNIDVDCPGYIEEKHRRHVLETIHERIEKQDGASLHEILESECISEELYLNCLRCTSVRGTNIILERDIGDCNTNNCNLDCLKLWRANMDIQYVADPYSCIMYVLSYVMKCENGMSEILKRVGKEFKDETIQSQMKKIISTFANKREVTIHEAVKRVLSQWLFKKSRTVVKVVNNPEEERHRMPKSEFELANMDEDDENVFMTSIHDMYAARPDQMESMCLAEFATQYRKCESRNKKAIKLKDDSLGCIIKRSKSAVLRTHRFSDEDFRYYYSKLLLFLPWRKESELAEGYGSCKEHYNVLQEVIERNAEPYNMNMEEVIDNALDDYVHNPVKTSEWLEAGIVADEEGNEEIIDENVGDNVCKMSKEVKDKSNETPLSMKYRAEALKPTMSAEEYCVMWRNLNDEQREIVRFNRMSAKQSVAKMRAGEEPTSYKIILNGSAGTGKSFVIKMINRDNIHIYRGYYARCAGLDDTGSYEDIVTIVSAFTGTASFNVNGMTLHSAFQLSGRGRGISDEKKTILRTQLHRLQQLTIDEISMVGEQTFKEVSKRCSMIKHTDGDEQNFGNISVLVVGDLYQLAPVKQREIYFKSYKDAMSVSELAPSLWDKFLFHELTQVMRQKDKEFADMLNEVRVGTPEENSVADRMLKDRELDVSEEDENYPNDVLHVYAQNYYCGVRNETMLNKTEGQMYTSIAEDRLEDVKIDMSQIDLSSLHASETGNLSHILQLKVHARVFVSNNIDVSDGLTNGVFGTISHVIADRYDTSDGEVVEKIRVVLVKFDSERVGQAAKAKSAFKHIDSEAVPISRIETTFATRKNVADTNKKQVRVIRKQFPLLLAWAVTIHKVQGMTMDQIVVDMSPSKGRFQKGQAYVAFSRVRTYQGLHLINYTRHQIKANGRVRAEMDRLRREKRLPVLPEAVIWSLNNEYMKIVHLNAQGLNYRGRTKQTDVQMDKELQEVDILCLTETHFQETDNIDTSFFWTKKKGEVYRKERRDRKGGGVAVVVSEKYVSRKIHIESSLEVVGVEVFGEKKATIICIYIPPSMSKVAAACHLERMVTSVSNIDEQIIIVGDFNEDLLIPVGNKIIRNCFEDLGFKQHVKTATTDYGSLLDHVYSRSVDDVTIDIQDTYYSDHDRVFCFAK